MTLLRGPAAQQVTLGRRVGRAAAWSMGNSIVLRLATFSVGVIAARVIAPEQFGVFAVALTVHAILVNVSDLGVASYLVRCDERLDRVGPTVTTVAMASAAVLTLAMAAAAPSLASALGAPEAAGPVRVLSLTLLLAGVSSVPSALLTREFRQDRRFVADLSNFAGSTGVLIPLGLMGAGASALAWSRVAGILLSTMLLLRFAPARYVPGLDRTVLGSLARFGMPLVGASFLGMLIGNIDYMVVGRVMGAEPLGLYYLAYNIGSAPYGLLTPIVTSVAMAAFARVRHDRGQLADRMGASMAVLLAVGVPANALIAALATPLITAVYGPRWSGAGAALALTAMYGAMRLPADLLSNVTIAEGRTGAMLALQIAYIVVLLPATVVGVHLWGITGAGMAHVAAIAVVLLPGFFMVLGRSTGFGPRRFARAALTPVAASGLAALVAHLLAERIGSPWPALLAGGAGGLAVYLVLIFSWARRLRASTRRLWNTEDVPEAARPRWAPGPSPDAAHA